MRIHFSKQRKKTICEKLKNFQPNLFLFVKNKSVLDAIHSHTYIYIIEHKYLYGFMNTEPNEKSVWGYRIE